MHFISKLSVLIFVGVSACTTAPPTKGHISKPGDGATQTAPISIPTDEAALVRSLLTELQFVSIQQGVEFCGFVGTNSTGRLVVSKPVRGDKASCLPEYPRNISIITASYHTHGGYDPEYLGELPSPSDVAGDLEMGVNGYVSTPGGRFWYIDSQSRQLTQICGFGCLPNDGRFPRGGDGPIAETYTFASLSRRHGQ